MAALYGAGPHPAPPSFLEQRGDSNSLRCDAPPPHVLDQDPGETLASPELYPFPQKGAYPGSFDFVRSEYDCFVNGVISHVLIRIDDEPSPTPSPFQEKTDPLKDETAIQNPDDLYWGSDLSFGPNGYHPTHDGSSTVGMEQNLLYIYGGSMNPATYSAPVPTEVEQIPPPRTLGGWSVEISEGDDGETYKIRRKKRRRLLHIIAERNRRRNQNDLYEELYRIVPGLEQARSTKREVLERTADWVEKLMMENKKLEEQLHQLTSGTQYVGEGYF